MFKGKYEETYEGILERTPRKTPEEITREIPEIPVSFQEAIPGGIPKKSLEKLIKKTS